MNGDVLSRATRIRELLRNVVRERKMCTTEKEMDRWCNSFAKEWDKVNCSKLAFIYVPPPVESVVDIILQLNKWSFPSPPPDTRNCNERYFVSTANARPRSLKPYFLTPNLSLAIIFLKFVDKPADVLRVMTE